MVQALESLRFAERHLSGIAADTCVDLIDGWRDDERRWQKVVKDLPTALSERDALAELGLKKWISCGYGSAGPQLGSPEYKVLSLNRTSARPEASLRS
jgi:hypothetical protein